MNKTFVSLCMATALVGFASCATTQNAVSVDAINGEWNIIEIDGSAVVPAPGQEFPFIAFDVQTGRVSGNAGCNRLMGTFDVNAKPGEIDLSALGSTRMMCPDMTVEKKVLDALSKVKKYKKLGDNIGLYASSKKPLVVLQKRAATLTTAELEGRWMVVEAGGEALPTEMETRPYVEFNTAERKVHGHAGCNLVNGAYVTDEANATAISFPQLATTMMACPDMEVETRVLKALNDVRTFGKLANGNMGFYDADNTLVLVLTKE